MTNIKSIKINARSLIVPALLLIQSAGNAQFVKGDWLAEGTIGNISIDNNKYVFSNAAAETEQKEKSTSFLLNPSAGYFIGSSLAVGLNLGIGYRHFTADSYDAGAKLSSTTVSVNSNLSVAPFLRWYFAGNTALRWYAQVKGGFYSMLSDSYETTSYNAAGKATSRQTKNPASKLHGATGEAMLGINYFLSPGIAFNTSLGYAYTQYRSAETSTNTNLVTNTFSTGPALGLELKNSSIAWNIGFTMILHGQKK